MLSELNELGDKGGSTRSVCLSVLPSHLLSPFVATGDLTSTSYGLNLRKVSYCVCGFRYLLVLVIL